MKICHALFLTLAVAVTISECYTVPDRNVDVNKGRDLSSLGGGNILRSLEKDSRQLSQLGGGNILRDLSSLGGGNILRSLPQNPNLPTRFEAKRAAFDLINAHDGFGFDSRFSKRSMFDPIENSMGFERFVKKRNPFDLINAHEGFGRFV